jgi:hypothetical protein
MSINTLIGTFSSIDINSGATTIDSSNLICIDTSNNRIGINTIDPSCSIHIINNTSYADNSIQTYSIKTPHLYITDISVINVSPYSLIELSANPLFNLSEVYCDLSGYLRLRRY